MIDDCFGHRRIVGEYDEFSFAEQGGFRIEIAEDGAGDVEGIEVFGHGFGELVDAADFARRALGEGVGAEDGDGRLGPEQAGLADVLDPDISADIPGAPGGKADGADLSPAGGFAFDSGGGFIDANGVPIFVGFGKERGVIPTGAAFEDRR